MKKWVKKNQSRLCCNLIQNEVTDLEKTDMVLIMAKPVDIHS
jgi:hypothetical protein